MSKKRILLIEDDKFIDDLYSRVLSQSGYEVDTAMDGQTGLDKALSENYDLILLDIMLPEKNGVEVLTELKANEEVRNIPVLVLSNLGEETMITKCLSLGAIGYMIKANNTPKEIALKVNEIFS